MQNNFFIYCFFALASPILSLSLSNNNYTNSCRLYSLKKSLILLHITILSIYPFFFFNNLNLIGFVRTIVIGKICAKRSVMLQNSSAVASLPDHSPTLCLMCFVVCILGVLGLHTNWHVAWSC